MMNRQFVCSLQAGLEGLRLLVREQATTIEALRAEQVPQRNIHACTHGQHKIISTYPSD